MNSILWNPKSDHIKKTNIESLRKIINSTKSSNLKTYQELYEWSISNISDFWETIWNDVGIIHSDKYHAVLDNEYKMYWC